MPDWMEDDPSPMGDAGLIDAAIGDGGSQLTDGGADASSINDGTVELDGTPIRNDGGLAPPPPRVDASASETSSADSNASGCACRSTSNGASGVLWLLLALLIAPYRRRR